MYPLFKIIKSHKFSIFLKNWRARVCVCVCVVWVVGACARVRICACVRVRACAPLCVCTSACVFFARAFAFVSIYVCARGVCTCESAC